MEFYHEYKLHRWDHGYTWTTEKAKNRGISSRFFALLLIIMKVFLKKTMYYWAAAVLSVPAAPSPVSPVPELVSPSDMVRNSVATYACVPSNMMTVHLLS